MAGGSPGSTGSNYWYRRKTTTQPPSEHAQGTSKDEEEYTIINLGGSNQCRMKAGDRIVISESGARFMIGSSRREILME
jgi:5-oxoprolinase (ATP-hydrolysing)